MVLAGGRTDYKVAWAGGEEDSDDDACAITAVTRVDDPVASIDLCEEDEATKAAATAAAEAQRQHNNAAPAADAAGAALKDGYTRGLLNFLDEEAQNAKLQSLWESTKHFVDKARKTQPNKQQLLLELKVSETGLCSNIMRVMRVFVPRPVCFCPPFPRLAPVDLTQLVYIWMYIYVCVCVCVCVCV